MAKKIETKRKLGRPAGAKTVDRDVVAVIPGCCQKCGSTNREPYDKVLEREMGGRLNGGIEYSHVVWRRTKCRACGQARTERHYENRRAQPNPKKAA